MDDHLFSRYVSYNDAYNTSLSIDVPVNQIPKVGKEGMTPSDYVQQQTNNDLNLYKLHNNPLLADSKNQIDTTMYASLCWTVVATSLLYIVFVELE